MKTMNFLAVLFLIFLLGGCTKDENNNTLNYRITKITYTHSNTGDSWTDLYLYDTKNRLFKIVGDSRSQQFDYNADGTLDKVTILTSGDRITYQWYYKGMVADHVVKTYINDGSLWETDTTYYTFSDDLSQLTNAKSVLTDFYNGEVTFNRTVTRNYIYSNNYLSKIVTNDGVTDYFYTGDGDLTKVIYNRTSGSQLKEGSPEYFQTEYSYDNKTNLFKAALIPAEWIMFNYTSGESSFGRDLMHLEETCTNQHNITSMINTTRISGVTNTKNEVYNIEEYNPAGLPLKIRENSGINELSYETYGE